MGQSAVAPAAPAAPGGDPVRRLVHRLHGGEQMGLLWQLWITVAGFAPLLLGGTGILVWLRAARGEERLKRSFRRSESAMVVGA